ncbi:hypothetical protein GE061_000279 [Apolygus lucorum]|uniref:Uncharacterized protein n=1 Tax=Apolygus lucorum TaxID=248454 RepID=A0A8S9Y3U1_APOLU|nr:hypothetical protein GE061_000279 [Apolygus lucorum]
MNPFLVVAILSFGPLYSSCLDLNISSSLHHVVSHDKINSSSEMSSLPGHVHVVHANDTELHSTLNSSKVKSASIAEQKTKPVISNSSTTQAPSNNSSVHATVQGNSSLKMENTTRSVGLQVMEGGGTLPPKMPSRKAPKTTEIAKKANNFTVVPETAMEHHGSISPRKGAPVEMLREGLPELAPSSTSTTTPRPAPRKKKPIYTMVVGDKFTKESESFIESPTTGKDYVLPLVLIIFAVPGFVFLVKFLYRRGTEFTERQQYHRMYLIDGDCRSPFLDRWGRVLKNFLWAENMQTVNPDQLWRCELEP